MQCYFENFQLKSHKLIKMSDVFLNKHFLKENLYSGCSHLLFETHIVILLKWYKSS